MQYRRTQGTTLRSVVRALAGACLLTVCLHTSARAQFVCRRYADASGRLISITDTGNLIEFWTSPTAEHIFSGNVQEGYTVSYDDRLAWNVHDDSSNVNVGTCSGTVSGIYPSGTTIVATVNTTTSDGRVRITSVFTWVAGTSSVRIDTTFTNIRASGNVVFKTAKRFVDANVDRNLTDNFGSNPPFEVFAIDLANNRRFADRIVATPVDVRVVAYHADFAKADFSVADDRNAELGAESSANDALVAFIDMRALTGGGIAAAPGAGITLSTTYTVSP